MKKKRAADDGMPKTISLGFVLAAFLSVTAICWGVGIWHGHKQYVIVKQWPTVEATVKDSQVDESGSSGSGSSSSTMYSADIVFHYEVNGKIFTTPSRSAVSTSNYASMKREVDEHPPGSRHSIKYNPADPNEIYYDAKFSFSFFFISIVTGFIGLVFFGFAAMTFWLSRVTKAPQCPACRKPVESGQKFCPNCAAPLGRE